MPSYTVEAPNGVKFDVEGDSPPTEQELNEIFETVSPAKASPTAEQDAFTEQFIREGTKSVPQQVLGALTAPARAGAGLAKGLGELLFKGVQGVGSLYGEASAQPTIADVVKNFNANAAQTVLEVLPRMAYEGGQGLVAGLQSPETAESTRRSLTAAVNPLGAALEALINPTAAPTQARADQAFQENILNQALAQQGEQGILAEAQKAAGGGPIGTANIDVSRAIPVVAPGVGAIPGAISRGAAAITPTLQRVFTSVPRAIARVTPTAETAGMSALNLAKEEVQNILPSAVPNITKAAGKSLPNAEEILQAVPKARQALFEETTSALTKVGDEGLVAKGGSAADDAIAAIRSDTRYMIDKADEAAALIEKYEKYRRDLAPLEARKFLEDTNSGLRSHWDKSAKGQKLDLTDAELRAEKAFGENLSGQVDELYQIGSRTFNDPYKQIGKIIELEKNLKLTRASAEKAFAERVSPSRRSGGTIPLGKGEVVRKGSRTLTSAFKNTELELLDKNLKGAFKGAPKPLNIVKIAEEDIAGLSRNYLPGETPPPLPVAPTPDAPSFSPSTLRALQEFGLTPDNPRWQTIGEQLEVATGSARPRVLLSETINR